MARTKTITYKSTKHTKQSFSSIRSPKTLIFFVHWHEAQNPLAIVKRCSTKFVHLQSLLCLQHDLSI